MIKLTGIVMLLAGLQGCTIVGSVLDSKLGIERSRAQTATLSDAGGYLDSELLKEWQEESSGGCATLSKAEQTACYQQASTLSDKIKKHREQR